MTIARQMPPSPSPRLFIDVTTLIHWSGPVTGMQRVEMELARYALTFRSEVGFVLFDKYRRIYRTVYPEFVRSKLNGEPVAGSADFRTRLTEIFRTLGRRAFDVAVATRDLEAIIGDAAPLTPNAVILAPGAEWEDKDPETIAELKRRHGHRLVMVCHDVIPIRFPEYFPVPLATTFQAYFRAAADFVDRFVCVSARTAQDLDNFFRLEALTRPDILVKSLGGHVLFPKSSPPLPEGLGATPFALFVSTIEPRKNHRLLRRVWLRLIERGIVVPTEFKLVLVGREGWQAKEFLAEVVADPRLAGSIIYLPNISDDVLAQLYQKAAFCVYPSLYEGFGLPVREALACGRGCDRIERRRTP